MQSSHVTADPQHAHPVTQSVAQGGTYRSSKCGPSTRIFEQRMYNRIMSVPSSGF